MEKPFQLRLSAYYSNGGYGRAWGVRQPLEFTLDPETGQEVVHFRGIAGTCRRKTGVCSLGEFTRWARYEVILNENSWQRVGYVEEVFPDADEL